MSIKTKMAKEIAVSVANKVGVLADMTKIVSGAGINIEAVAGYAGDSGEAEIMLVTSDNQRAIEALSKKYKPIEENDVLIIILEDKPGALEEAAAKLAGANIDIKYIYGTTCPSRCPTELVLSTSDNKKAIAVLK